MLLLVLGLISTSYHSDCHSSLTAEFGCKGSNLKRSQDLAQGFAGWTFNNGISLLLIGSHNISRLWRSGRVPTGFIFYALPDVGVHLQGDGVHAKLLVKNIIWRSLMIMLGTHGMLLKFSGSSEDL